MSVFGRLRKDFSFELKSLAADNRWHPHLPGSKVAVLAVGCNERAIESCDLHAIDPASSSRFTWFHFFCCVTWGGVFFLWIQVRRGSWLALRSHLLCSIRPLSQLDGRISRPNRPRLPVSAEDPNGSLARSNPQRQLTHFFHTRRGSSYPR